MPNDNTACAIKMNNNVNNCTFIKLTEAGISETLARSRVGGFPNTHTLPWAKVLQLVEKASWSDRIAQEVAAWVNQLKAFNR